MRCGPAFNRDHFGCSVETGLKESVIRGREVSEEGGHRTNLERRWQE